MSDLSRRAFIKNAATSAAAASLLSAAFELHANPLGLPIGCQTWPVRDGIAKDFPGTIKQLAAAGFQNIELCSPVGYDDSGFGGLAQYKGSELHKMLNDWGVACISSHFGIAELRKDQPGRIAWAQDLGLKQMIVPSLDGPKNPTLDDVKRAADEFHEISRPLLFHARPRLVRPHKENRRRRPRQPRLEKNIHCRKNRGRPKLFRGNEPRPDESQRPLPSQSPGLTRKSAASDAQKE
jgi:hypothetical protein